jgi:hypothetical protein
VPLRAEVGFAAFEAQHSSFVIAPDVAVIVCAKTLREALLAGGQPLGANG